MTAIEAPLSSRGDQIDVQHSPSGHRGVELAERIGLSHEDSNSSSGEHVSHEFEKDKIGPKVNVTSVAEDADGDIPDVRFDGEFAPEKPVFGGSLKGSVLDFWWQEMIAIVVMMLSMGLIILILGIHNHQPFPHWPFKITINALVSILVTVMKATMLAILAAGIGQHKWLWFKKKSRPLAHFNLYEKAGQGPNYASQMLFVLRGKQIFACLALAVIIISTGLDPFTQQVIQNREVVLPMSTGVVTVPRTTVYDVTGLHVGAGLSTMDNSMLSAIMAGLYTPGTDFGTVTATGCTTGNCTFPTPYSTLEMCGTCIDLSDQLTGICFLNHTNEYTQATYNISLPSGNMLQVLLEDPYQFLQASIVEGLTEFSVDSLTSREFIYRTVNNMTAGELPQTCDSCTGTDCGYSAASCKLYPCVNTYTAEVANTSLSETLVSTSVLPLVERSWANLNKTCLTDKDKDYLLGVGINIDDYQEWIPYPVNGEYFGLNVTSECYYDFSNVTLFSFMYLDDYLNFMEGLMLGYSPNTTTGPPDLSFIYDSGRFGSWRLNDTFQSIATTVSARMRNAGDANFSSPAAHGIVYQKETVIAVRWAWLVLPLSLVLVTLVFAIVTMIDTSTQGRKPIGKAFNLGLLLSGVAGQVTDQVGDLKYVHQAINRFTDMKLGHDEAVKSAQALKVQFKETAEGWRLVKV